MHSIAATNSATTFWHTVIGKKVVMAITGVVLIGFVLAHMVGNLKIFSGPAEIDAYSRFLREVGSPGLAYGELLWVVRIVLLTCVALHMTAAVQLSRMSWAARPAGYEVKRNIETTFAARVMRWGGLLLVVFVVFHLFHLTGGAVGFQPGQFVHLAVYRNVIAAFAVWPVAIFYIVAMAALCLHLYHGIWSMLQTLGWNTARNQAKLKNASRAIAITVFLGFSSVPVSVLRVGCTDRLHKGLTYMMETRIPTGPIEQKWDQCRYEMKLVNPANRRKHTVIIVGTGIGGSGGRGNIGSTGISGPMLLLP